MSISPAALGLGDRVGNIELLSSVLLIPTVLGQSFLAPDDSRHPWQATRNGIRVGDLRDFATFADSLRELASDAAKRFEGFGYDVEADIEAYRTIVPRVLPLITDTV